MVHEIRTDRITLATFYRVVRFTFHLPGTEVCHRGGRCQTGLSVGTHVPSRAGHVSDILLVTSQPVANIRYFVSLSEKMRGSPWHRGPAARAGAACTPRSEAERRQRRRALADASAWRRRRRLLTRDPRAHEIALRHHAYVTYVPRTTSLFIIIWRHLLPAITKLIHFGKHAGITVRLQQVYLSP